MEESSIANKRIGDISIFTNDKVMKRSLAEMTSDRFGSSRHQSKTGSEMTVFERQRTQMKILQQQHQSSTSEAQYHDQVQRTQGSGHTQSLATGDIELQNTLMMLDHCLGWTEYGHISMQNEMPMSLFDCGNKYRLETKMSSHTTAKSARVPRNRIIAESDENNSVATENPKSDLVIIEESPQVTRINLSSINSKEMSADSSKENSRLTEIAKPDYIQVRARRGQATDRHSLAERVRREKISQKMRFLQDLVPGCNKITGKTGMLDEIINYVQALQSQVEFLSMKLAAGTTALNFTVPDACITSFPLNQIQAPTISKTIHHSSSTAQLGTAPTPSWACDNFQDTDSFTLIPAWDADFRELGSSEFHQLKHTTFTFPSQ